MYNVHDDRHQDAYDDVSQVPRGHNMGKINAILEPNCIILYSRVTKMIHELQIGTNIILKPVSF